MTELAKQRCDACTGDTPVLTADEVARLEGEISAEWSVHEGAALVRRQRFEDFARAFQRATAVAAIAEEEGHHPELTVGWGHLDIVITTHAVGGLTRNDFILAAKIDELSA
ncbi:MAG: 4a-hydroxytetrahydrobiopterin dehydratase [Candidatus Dormibacteria bacterium]